MNTHIPDLKKDLKIGKIAEKNIHSILEDKFNMKLINTDKFNKYCNFDFVSKDKKIWIEHKYRGRYKSNLNTYFCDLVKYKKFKTMKEKNKDIRCFIVWTWSDCRKIWEMTDTETDENDENYFYIENQFRDRGRGFAVHTEVMNVFNDKTCRLDEFEFNQNQE
tara:strand:- start:1630 stop:2118 length:489 start_codon:yes stop_codon:yes gene_type:complete